MKQKTKKLGRKPLFPMKKTKKILITLPEYLVPKEDVSKTIADALEKKNANGK